MKRFLVLLTVLAADASAQKINPGASVAAPAKDDSVATELASFEIAGGFEVALFASEEHGIANPVAMRWGPRGRLWVLCTLVYPQIIPDTPPQDKLYILEDTDRDGRADKVLVFADGLDMPTGFALGNGGVYLGEGSDLVFLQDTDHDDRADRREVLLTGFGTGDTHQNINSFTWSPGGELLFCQGLHNFSRVETPWGIVRMDEHGVWRLRPKRRQLHAFRGCSGQNPWGLSFGHWGEPFAKSNGSEVSELLPVMVHTEKRHRPLDIGRTHIKSMICEIVDSPALPSLQDNIVIAGYFAHIVDRLKMSTDGSGHRGELLPPIFRTDHQSFRPVDIQTGPDGALYVADWYNPIIGHYQASLRHPDRDKLHGRIWRVTEKGVQTFSPANLEKLPTSDLLKRLASAPLKERERIRITLSQRDGKAVLTEVAAWIRGLDPAAPNMARHLFEALALHEWNETVNRPLLERLLAAQSPLARAYATRVVGRWHDRLADPLALLANSVRDAHPRVRLEAVVAASQFESSAAMTLAAEALDQPMDRFLTAALVQTTHALKSHWFPEIMAGTVSFARPAHLAFALQQTSGQDAAATARRMLKQPGLAPPVTEALLAILAQHGTAADLRHVLSQAAGKPAVLAALVDSARLRPIKPPGDPELLLRLLYSHDGASEKAAAIRLASLWNVPGFRERIRESASNKKASKEVRIAAIETMGHRAGAEEVALLGDLIASPEGAIKEAALGALTKVDLPRAAATANGLLRAAEEDDDLAWLVGPFLERKDGPPVLAEALALQPVDAKLANRVRAVLGAAGRHSPALERVLAPKPKRNAIGIPEYREQFVRKLALEVKQHGDAKKGSEIYHRDALSCTMCHVIDLCGRPFGPDLSAVGAGLPAELIIESIVWPRRQIKEGFLSTTITTKTGRVVSGHLKREDKQRIVIRDPASQSDRSIAPRDVASRQDAGSIMPPGLTANLTREELRDLVRFLTERKGQAPETK